MYNYFVWDKKSSINNCDADEILKSEPFCKMNKIVFFTHNEKPFVHADTDELRKELQIPSSESDEFVYETYIKILEEKENESQQEQTNLEKMRDKISILEAENGYFILDSAIKDSKISTLENDLADLTLEIAMMEVR